MEESAGAQTVQTDGVVADELDDLRHDVHRACVVASDAERAAVRRAHRSAVVLKFVVADVVEGLDDRRPGKPTLNDLAAAVLAIFRSEERRGERVLTDV